MGFLSRLADNIDKRLEKIAPLTAEEKKARNRARKEARCLNEQSRKARYYPADGGTRFKTTDETVYGWLDRKGDGTRVELRVLRGIWPKGHAGKVLRKRFNKLHRQGHHSAYECMRILGHDPSANH